MKNNWLTNNWILKIMALGLAIITWMYANSILIKSTP